MIAIVAVTVSGNGEADDSDDPSTLTIAKCDDPWSYSNGRATAFCKSAVTVR